MNSFPHSFRCQKNQSNLLCHPVQASKKGEQFDSVRGAIHVMIADASAHKKYSLQRLEEDVYFPFISSEIFRLIDQKKLSFRHFAVLVRDRNQAFRLTQFFEQEEIPYLNQRGSSLSRSTALKALTALIQALLHPRNRGNVLAAFGTPLFGWNEELEKFRDDGISLHDDPATQVIIKGKGIVVIFS